MYITFFQELMTAQEERKEEANGQLINGHSHEEHETPSLCHVLMI